MVEKATFEEVVSLMDNLKKVIDRQKRVIRWGGYDSKYYNQSSFEHTYILTLLTGLCLKLERHCGGQFYNDLSIMNWALVHDIGEGVTGDITYKFKNHPLIKDIYPIVEQEQTKITINGLGPMADFCMDVYSQQGLTKKEQEFTHAMELLDYMLYALNEYFVYGNKEFVKVFKRQFAEFGHLAKIFPSVNLFYQAIEKKVAQAIEENHEYLKNNHADVEKMSEEHIKTLEKIIKKAKKDLL